MYCKNCGKQIPEDSKVCPECGTVLVDYNSDPSYDYSNEMDEMPKGNGFAITSFVLSFFTMFGCCFYIGIPMGIIGIIFGAMGLKSAYKGLSIAGIVINSIFLVLSVLATILGIALAPMLADS